MQDIKMSKTKLPKDWKIVKVGKYVISTKGKKPKIISKEKTDECHLPYVNIKAFEKGIVDEYTDGVGCVICEEGDFLMVWDGSRSGYVGKAIRGALGSTLVRLNFPDLENNYAYYFLQSKYIEINTRAKGVGIPHVDPNLLWNYDLLIPPIKIQQDIVSKIEELFSELDKGIEDLKTAQQQLKTYRQSVLNLLATNENLMPIEKIIDKLDQGWSPKCENQASDDKTQWAVIKTSAVQQGCFVEIENKILPTNLSPKEQHEIEVGDILITRAGPRVRVGVCCMVKHTRPKLINCDKVYRIKVNKKLILPEYFEYILNTPKYQDEIEKMKSGISDSGLNLTQKVFVQITIPVPPLKEQHQIVQEIESRLSVADKMEESIVQSLQQAESLRQSILKKAFSGELV